MRVDDGDDVSAEVPPPDADITDPGSYTTQAAEHTVDLYIE